MKKININKQFLIKEYINNNKSMQVTAKELNCHLSTIRRALCRFKIPIRTISESMKDINKGKNNGHYIDGRAPLEDMIRSLFKYKEWRTNVFQRDNYICQDCGLGDIKLEAHHKKSFAKLLTKFLQEYNQFSPIEDKEILTELAIRWDSFWKIDNGKTLCKKCHNITKRITK